MADEKKKKYPWIKSIFRRKKKPGMEGVYAGPAEMEGRFFNKVYAGPPKEDDPSQYECVYAGPEYFENMGRDPGSGREFEDVYAGPEFFGESEPVDEEPADEPVDEEPADEPENGPDEGSENEPGNGIEAGPSGSELIPPESIEKGPGKYPEGRPDDELAMAGVYAGPAEMAGPGPAPMMLAYAGPEYLRNGPAFRGMMGPAYAGPAINDVEGERGVYMDPEKDAKENKKTEDTEAEELAKRVAKELKQSNYCKVCGTKLHHGVPFCPNCGTKV